MPCSTSLAPWPQPWSRQPVQACQRGDRLGICVTQLDSKLVERGLACTPGKLLVFSRHVERASGAGLHDRLTGLQRPAGGARAPSHGHACR